MGKRKLDRGLGSQNQCALDCRCTDCTEVGDLWLWVLQFWAVQGDMDGPGGLGSFLCLSDFYRFFKILSSISCLHFVAPVFVWEKFPENDWLWNFSTYSCQGRKQSWGSREHSQYKPCDPGPELVNPFSGPCLGTLALCQRWGEQ